MYFHNVRKRENKGQEGPGGSEAHVETQACTESELCNYKSDIISSTSNNKSLLF